MIVSTVVKLIVSAAGVDERYAVNNWDRDSWEQIED
jgi:hypothetical protein